jgi:Transposase zinc-ribbon domain
MLQVVEDYPRTLAELEARFSSEQACRDYLFRLRWPEGFRCSRCGETKAWLLQSGRWQCTRCGHQTSVTAGTIFQDTRTPLTIWFRAMRSIFAPALTAVPEPHDCGTLARSTDRNLSGTCTGKSRSSGRNHPTSCHSLSSRETQQCLALGRAASFQSASSSGKTWLI